MKLLVTIDRSVVTDPEMTARMVRAFLLGVIAQNRLLMRLRKVPSLYGGSIRYQREAGGAGVEELADALTVAKRGFGDCEDLCAYRCAELQEKGINALPKIYWRPIARRGRTKGIRLFHVEVRLPDGSVEDPSRMLGM